MPKRVTKIRWPWVSTWLVVFCLLNLVWSTYAYVAIEPMWIRTKQPLSPLLTRRGVYSEFQRLVLVADMRFGLMSHHNTCETPSMSIGWKDLQSPWESESQRQSVEERIAFDSSTAAMFVAQSIYVRDRDYAGFSWLGEMRELGGVQEGEFGIAIHWLWFVGASTLLAIVRWRRYFILGLRRSRGHCIACGYDLRAATGDVCSECGAARTLAASPPTASDRAG